MKSISRHEPMKFKRTQHARSDHSTRLTWRKLCVLMAFAFSVLSMQRWRLKQARKVTVEWTIGVNLIVVEVSGSLRFNLLTKENLRLLSLVEVFNWIKKLFKQIAIDSQIQLSSSCVTNRNLFESIKGEFRVVISIFHLGSDYEIRHKIIHHSRYDRRQLWPKIIINYRGGQFPIAPQFS